MMRALLRLLIMEMLGEGDEFFRSSERKKEYSHLG